MKPRSLVENTAALLVIQIVNQLLPLATLPYLTRVLGVDGYGVYAYTLSIITLAGVITDFGFNLWATAEVSRNSDDRHYINWLLGAVTAARFLLAVAATLIIWIYAWSSAISQQHGLVLFAAGVAVIATAIQPIWLFNGLEQMAHILVVVLASRLMYTALIFAIIASPSDLTSLIGINALAQFVTAGLAIYIFARRGYVPAMPTLADCRFVLTKSAPFFLSRAAVSTYTAGGAFFLGLVSTSRSVGMYSVAEQLYRGAQGLLSPLAQVMYPYMMRTRNFRVLAKAIAIISIAAALGVLLTALLADRIVSVLFGPSFVEAVPVLYVFLAALLINTPSVMLGYPTMGALGRLELANRSVVFAACVQIALLTTLYFTSRTSPIYVAFTVLIAEVIVLSVRVIWGCVAWRGGRLA